MYIETYLSQSWSQATAGVWFVVHDASTVERGSRGMNFLLRFFCDCSVVSCRMSFSGSFSSQFDFKTVPTTAQPASPAAKPHARLPFRAQDMALISNVEFIQSWTTFSRKFPQTRDKESKQMTFRNLRSHRKCTSAK